MATFQEERHYADSITKHPISAEDVEFLKKLQTELNTQSARGNAQPVFWVIKGQQLRAATKEEATVFTLTFCGVDFDVTTTDGIHAFLTSDEFSEYMRECGHELRVERREPEGILVELDPSGDDPFSETLQTTADLQAFLEDDAGAPDYYVEWNYSAMKPHVYEDTLFLTHVECQNHLRKYGYNYDETAHAFAMTATRSPEFERLLKTLRTVDWTALANVTKGENDA